MILGVRSLAMVVLASPWLAAVAPASASDASESWRDQEIYRSNLGEVIRGTIQGSFSPAHDVERYEGLANAFRSSMQQTSEGDLKLQFFYEGFAEHTTTIDAFADRWSRRYPSSPAPHLLKAQRLLAGSVAFIDGPLRGPGSIAIFARNPQGLAATDRALDRIAVRASSDPYWYTLKVTVAAARMDPPSTVERIVAEGLKRHPRNVGLAIMGANRFLPKWGGSADELDAFARRMTAIAEPAEGKGLYARIYWQAFIADFQFDVFRRSKADWSLMKPALDDLLARHPGQKNRNIAALFACLAGDLEETKRHILARDIVYHMGVWHDRQALSACWRWAGGIVEREPKVEKIEPPDPHTIEH